MFKGKVVAFALMLLFATSLYAGDVDDCLSNAGMLTWDGVVGHTPTVCALMQITICPQGDFELISHGCGSNPPAADWIWIQALNSSGVPIQGIPWTDYWINSCNSAKQLCLCATPLTADSLTGADGKTSFSGRIVGGGCTLTQGLWIAIQGKQVLSKPCPPRGAVLCLNIIVKSPDLRGGTGGVPDCKVNTSDLGPFVTTYNKRSGQGGYNACCDYNDDNRVSLSDFGALGQHYNHKCQ